MFLERTNVRIQLTIVLSIVLHMVLIGYLKNQRHQSAIKPSLTEVEFIEQIEKPTQMEKMIKKLMAPSPAAASQGKVQEAIEQLEQASFSKVVGLKKEIKEITPIDLNQLAKLPEPDFKDDGKSIEPAIESGKKIKLKGNSQKEKLIQLQTKVVALAELPSADFDLDIERKQFQQPEQIIKNVRAEKSQQSTTIKKKLSLNKAAFIEGEVKDREIIRQAKPEIPRWLEEKGIEAQVVIRFAVDPDGMVNERLIIEKTSGYPELDQLAKEALRKFVFVPLPLNVKQVEQTGIITLRFTVVK